MRVRNLDRTQGSFNSRTREGCDLVADIADIIEPVSIHAPARGAITATRWQQSPNSFNSRTREGCDWMEKHPGYYTKVSIHAPARGAMLGCCKIGSRFSFNSRTREGCDVSFRCGKSQGLFQFTHPRGVR